MAEDWSPKTREDWQGLFSDAFKSGVKSYVSEREEEEAKSQGDKDKEKEVDDDAKPRKSFGERLLGL
jgi:hypothetical protein